MEVADGAGAGSGGTRSELDEVSWRRGRDLHPRYPARGGAAVHRGSAIACRRRWTLVAPFGATSLHDAVARTAKKRHRLRDVVAAQIGFDDGRLLPVQLHRFGEVSGIASSIALPVYIVGIVPAIDNPSLGVFDDDTRALGTLRPAERSGKWTGGHVFVVAPPPNGAI